ncbi:oligosaccharide flippase family protein [Frankia sp. CNm7]|uniref:Oligosaccharide flippase family protein n=1 Tax=Frankia nepalensis TaxID=1836974 RepID=A0A937RME9_9ACTN|nr:oligosaccharide flippase family protein [Frankia nepalensis]MBL7502678.1 oligosaccharide flippase family protein [Frankia nepalensis]MBL7515530.1 oligosaccharide flippase family protein [Frankia nepalensis]MBL7522791.1 oligosaccharide flippase family protein [Frankia nepalensis]MBL7629063.1 oligosaccharide flippase family protein [Frankia nepalensis]
MLSAVADQAVSSGTNFLTTLLLARLLVPEEFGRVVLAMTVAMLTTAATRACVGDVLLVLPPAADRREQRRDASGAVSTAALIGMAALVVCVLVGRLGPPVTAYFGVFAWWLPVLAIQDTLRYVAFRRRSPARALALDVLWAAAQFGAIGVVLLSGRPSATSLITCWGVGATAGAVVGLWLVGIDVRGFRPFRWLRRTRETWGWFASIAFINQMQAQILLWVATAMVGAAAIGGLRAAQTLLMAPTASLLMALQSLILPSMTRLVAEGDLETLRRFTIQLAGATGATAAVVGLGACLGRDALITTVFTAQFAPYAGLLVPVACMIVCMTVTTPYLAAIGTLRDIRGTFQIQLISAAVTMPACILGTLAFGIAGCAFGLPLAGVARIIACRRVFGRLAPGRRPRRRWPGRRRMATALPADGAGPMGPAVVTVPPQRSGPAGPPMMTIGGRRQGAHRRGRDARGTAGPDARSPGAAGR